MSDSVKTFVPQTLDAAPKFLFWDFDVALLFILAMGVGIMAGQMLAGIAAGGFLAWRYGKAKSGRNPGYGVHLMYWHLPVGVQLRRGGGSGTRNFIG